MRTDKLAYLWLQEVPEGFFALFGRDKADAQRYDFKSVELKETAFRIDGVFAPQETGDVTYFVEMQFQPDDAFYARFFAEIFLYLRQFQVGRWRAVAVFPSRTIEPKNHEAYQPLLDSDFVLRVYLDELPNIDALDETVGLFKLVVEPEKTAIKVERVLIERAPTQLDFIERVLFYKFKNLSRKEILKMLSIREEFEEELKKTRAYQEILEEGKETGLREGLAQGALRAKLETVPLLRELGLSDEVIAARLNLAIEQVKSV